MISDGVVNEVRTDESRPAGNKHPCHGSVSYGYDAHSREQPLRSGIDIDERWRELIESCTDLDTLNGWFRRAFKVDKASDLFEE
jgi:hypothetical protein